MWQGERGVALGPLIVMDVKSQTLHYMCMLGVTGMTKIKVPKIALFQLVAFVCKLTFKSRLGIQHNNLASYPASDRANASVLKQSRPN